MSHASTLLKRAYHHALATHFPSYLRKLFHTFNPSQRYIHNWHIDAISEYLNALSQGHMQRLVINMPPRSLKSLSVTVGWSSFMLGQEPTRKIITASYSSALSVKHAMDVRALIATPWYRQAFPHMRIMAGQNEKHKFATTQHGFRLATSVGGTLTGEGGDIIIIDDPLNPQQAMSSQWRNRANQWFDHTLSSRLNDKTRGAMLIVMQRLHENDLTGHVLGKGGWEHLCLPAIAQAPLTISIGDYTHHMEQGSVLQPEREPHTLLNQLRIDLGSAAFCAQYLQAPTSQQGHMVHANWIHTADPMPDAWDMVVQSWDCAIKSGAQHDRSACVTLGVCDGRYFVIDVLAVRAEYPELRRLILSHAQQHMPDAVLIEDKASGQSLIQDLRTHTLPIIPILPKGDKVQRLARITPWMESGHVAFPAHAAWREDCVSELLTFPHGAHDDIVDAFSQALLWLQQRDTKQSYIREL